MIRDLEKAYLVLQTPGLSLKDLAEKTNIKYQTLRLYKSQDDRLATAAASQISALANEWEQHPSFNLLTVPWIKVLSNKTFEEETVSLTELLENARDYRMLAGDMKIQDLAILRLTLAILLTVYSRFNAEGKSYDWLTIKQPTLTVSKVHADKYNEADLLATWKQLYSDKKFNDILFDYLRKNKNKFDLFGETPFYQVNKTIYDENVPANKRIEKGKGTVALKQLNRRIAESGNSKSIFSPKSGIHKNELRLAELARWLITYQNYTGVIDKTKVNPGKFSISAGWTFKLNPYFIQATNFFDTLMLNLTLVDETHEYTAQVPSWEWDKEDYIHHRLNLEKPTNAVEAYTLWARMLHVEFSDYFEPQVFSAGLPKLDTQEAFKEPMTLWRYSDTKKAFIPDKQMQKDMFTPTYLGWSKFVDSSEDKQHQSGIGYWLDYLYQNKLINPGKDVNLATIALIDDEKGSSQLPYFEKQDEIMTTVDKLCNKNWKQLIDVATNLADKISKTIWYFASSKNKLNGVNNHLATNLVEQYWYQLDFSMWLDDLDNHSKADSLNIWCERIKEVAIDVTSIMNRGVSAREIKGNGTNNYQTIRNTFMSNLSKAINKAQDAYLSSENNA